MALNLKQEFFRKLIHLSSFWIVALIGLAPQLISIILLSIVAVFVLSSEYETYKKQGSFCAKIYRLLFGGVLRDKEKGEGLYYSGAPYVLIAALILVIIMPKTVAMFAVSILLISDTMAALVGRSVGKHKLVGHKTWEGTLAFILSGFVVVIIFYVLCDLSLWRMMSGVLLGVLGDLYNEKLHVDDNLSIPLLAAVPFLF